MKKLSTLFAAILAVALISSCAGPKTCECGGTCESCTAASATECAGCAELMAGKTGWCADCGKGFYEGQEVKCVGECSANPGGPPCAACVK